MVGGRVANVREWDADDYFLEMLHPDWHAEAACRGMDPDIFYPVGGGASLEAPKICSECPVRQQCLEQGANDEYGIWGGWHPYERRLMKRQRRLQVVNG